MKIRDWLFSKKKQREKPEVIWLEETTSTNDEIRKLMWQIISVRDADRLQTDGKVKLERTCFSVS